MVYSSSCIGAFLVQRDAENYEEITMLSHHCDIYGDKPGH